ncbi:MAG: hypothetical protein ACJ8BE_13385, partial [Microvirga sp.]
GLFGGAAIACPSVVWAQDCKAPIRVGMLPLGSSSSSYDRSLVEAFRQVLREVDSQRATGSTAALDACGTLAIQLY